MAELPRQSCVTGADLITGVALFQQSDSAEEAGLETGAIEQLLDSDIYAEALAEALIMCGDDRTALAGAMTLFGVAVGVLAARGLNDG